MSQTGLIASPEMDDLPVGLVALFSRLGFAALIRDPDSADVLAASADAEAQMLAAEPGSVRVASARIGSRRVRVEILRNATDGPVILTPRQRAVARLLVAGMRNGDIALELQISTHTVRRHLESIFRRLQVQNRTAAAAELRRGHVKL